MSDMAAKYRMAKKRKAAEGAKLPMAKGGRVESDEETTHHVPVTSSGADSFGSRTYTVEHKSGTKRHFHANEGEHEDVRKQAEAYRTKNLPKKMAEGGEVPSCANCGHPQQADESPNEFDYTDAEAGEDSGQEDAPEEAVSLMSKILRSKRSAKK